MSRGGYYQVDSQTVPDSWMGLNGRKETLYDFIETAMYFLITYPTICAVTYLTTKSRGCAEGSSMVLFALLYLTYIRRCVRRNYLFILLLLPPPMIAYALPILKPARISVGIYLIVSLLVSCRLRANQGAQYKGIGFFIFGGAVISAEYIVLLACGHTGIAGVAAACCVAYSLLWLTYTHVSRTRMLMRWERQTSVQSLKRINSASLRFIAVMAVVFITAAFIIWRADYVGADYKLLQRIIARMNRFSLQTEMKERSPQSGPARNADIGDMLREVDKNGGGSNPLIGKVIQTLFTAIMIPAAAMFAITALRMLYLSISRYLSGRRGDGAAERELTLGIGDAVEKIRSGLDIFKFSIRSRLHLSNSGRIRRIYCGIVNDGKKRDSVIDRSDTPRQIEDLVMRDSKRDIRSATEIYEKARYGKDEPSGEDVATIKKLRDKGK